MLLYFKGLTPHSANVISDGGGRRGRVIDVHVVQRKRFVLTESPCVNYLPFLAVGTVKGETIPSMYTFYSRSTLYGSHTLG